MALHMNLMVNGQQIGYLEARRLTPVRPSGNDICRYEWHLNVNGETRSGIEPVEHRFGDGAWALVARIIDAAGHGPTSPGPRPITVTLAEPTPEDLSAFGAAVRKVLRNTEEGA